METLIDAIHEAITPHLSRIETKLDAVEKRIAAHVPRRPVTDSTKRRHRDVVSALGGRIRPFLQPGAPGLHGDLVDLQTLPQGYGRSDPSHRGVSGLPAAGVADRGGAAGVVRNVIRTVV